MSSIESLKDTIVPKSDQLNADDLITGPITVQVKAVTRGTQDQPVSIAISGGYQPYKPCKSMRRVLIALWGDNGLAWVGRWMTLYCDQSVRFGGVQVGGIRISHVSDIKSPIVLMLTTTRSKRAEYHVQPLAVSQKQDVSNVSARESTDDNEHDMLTKLQEAAAAGMDELMKAFSEYKKSPAKTEVWKVHGDALKKVAEEADGFDVVTFFKQAIDTCHDLETLELCGKDIHDSEELKKRPERAITIISDYYAKKLAELKGKA